MAVCGVIKTRQTSVPGAVQKALTARPCSGSVNAGLGFGTVLQILLPRGENHLQRADNNHVQRFFVHSHELRHIENSLRTR